MTIEMIKGFEINFSLVHLIQILIEMISGE